VRWVRCRSIVRSDITAVDRWILASPHGLACIFAFRERVFAVVGIRASSSYRLFDELGEVGPETALFLEEFDELGGPTIDPGPLCSGVYLPDLHCFFA
jgi:hypothetical protein